MDFFKLLGTRHSVRTFKDKPVEDAKLKKILEATNRAPSAGNLQAYEIYVVKDEDKRRALARGSLGQDSITEAPVVLIFFANPERSAWKYGKRGATLYCIQDAAIACAYAQLAVHDLGLATVWIGAFDEDRIRKAVGAPENIRPVSLLPIGYADEEPYVTERRKLDDFLLH
jgi:nitroreductase